MEGLVQAVVVAGRWYEVTFRCDSLGLTCECRPAFWARERPQPRGSE